MLAILLAVGGRLLGAAKADVPLWLLGVVLVVACTGVLAVVVIYERRNEHLKGELSEVRSGAGTLVNAARDDARERIETAEAQARDQIAKAEKEAESKVSATESFSRVNVSEAEERTRAVSAELQEARRQLAEATSGKIPLTREAEAVARSVRALVSDLDTSVRSDIYSSSNAQEHAFLAIVEQFQETFGDSSLLQRAYTIPTGRDEADPGGWVRNADIRDMLTMLGQLDAYALNHGQASAQS